MNDLFEGYIGECLKKVLNASRFKLDLQHKDKRLLLNINTGRENILLKPDFVVSIYEEQPPVPKVIIDPKWKSILVHSQLTYQQSDIYQMYAYITAYKSAELCIILYPKTMAEALFPKWLVPHSSPEKLIEIQTIRLDKTEHTIEDLKGMLANV